MNPLTHSKNSTILPLLTALALSAMTASASEDLPFRLGDEGTITFTSPSTATTAGTGNATRLGQITSDVDPLGAIKGGGTVARSGNHR